MNLPNKLTLGRIFLIPVFMFFLLVKITYGKYLAAFIFILAASTDGLDGYIARKRKQITNFGKIMDPLADKLLVTAALVSLVQLGEISAWPAFIILGREFAITGLRSVAAAEGVVVSASYLGKIKTVTQIIAISLILLEEHFLTDGYGSAIRLTRDNKFLYGAVRKSNYLFSFNVGENGLISLTQKISTEGDHPRDFNLIDCDKYLVVANMHSNDLSLFKIVNGKLYLKDSKYNLDGGASIIHK